MIVSPGLADLTALARLLGPDFTPGLTWTVGGAFGGFKAFGGFGGFGAFGALRTSAMLAAASGRRICSTGGVSARSSWVARDRSAIWSLREDGESADGQNRISSESASGTMRFRDRRPEFARLKRAQGPQLPSRSQGKNRAIPRSSSRCLVWNWLKRHPFEGTARGIMHHYYRQGILQA